MQVDVDILKRGSNKACNIENLIAETLLSCQSVKVLLVQ